MKPGSTLRFRLEDTARGIESSTWSLVGAKRTGDLYFAGRGFMGDLKLSLHASGISRMAWTAAAASQRVGSLEDRAMSRWTIAKPVGAGWALGLRLAIPDAALSSILPPLPSSSKPTVTLPAPGPGYVVHVSVMIGRPGAGSLRIEGEVEEIGRLLLGDGTRVLVIAWRHSSNEDIEAQLRSIRAEAQANRADERPIPRAFGWGTDASGVPFVMDAGDPRDGQDQGADIPYFDGPPSVHVAEMPPAARRPPPRKGSELADRDARSE